MIVQIWTDGSCWPNPGPGGWAWVRHVADRPDVSRSGHLPATTNIRAEMTAAIKALATLPGTGHEVLLTTDSEYVIRCLSIDGIKKLRKNADLYLALRKLLTRHHIKTNWVRGHTGQPQNELCDQLAMAARLNGQGVKV